MSPHFSDDIVSVAFELEFYNVSEGDGAVSVCVVLSGASIQRGVTVSLETDPSVEPRDFDQLATTLVFQPGSSTQQCANISIIDDSISEDMETFQAHLNSTDPAVILERATTTITIVDNDGEC